MRTYTYIALRWHRIGHANDENLNVADVQLVHYVLVIKRRRQLNLYF